MEIDYVPFVLDGTLEDGLYWIAGVNQVWDIDAGDDGQTVGVPTGKTQPFVALGFIEFGETTSGHLDFCVNLVDEANLGGYAEDSMIERVALVVAPPYPAAASATPGPDVSSVGT